MSKNIKRIIDMWVYLKRQGWLGSYQRHQPIFNIYTLEYNKLSLEYRRRFSTEVFNISKRGLV